MKSFLFLWILPAIVVAYSPVVDDLVRLIEQNRTLAGEVRHVLEAVYGEGTTTDDAFRFFDDWLRFLVTPSTVRKCDNVFSPFYASSRLGSRLVRRTPGDPWLHHFIAARGRFMDSPDSVQVLADWERDPTVNMSQYVVPRGGFTSFNEFFRRQFRPGLRRLCRPLQVDTLVSPVDGHVASFKELGGVVQGIDGVPLPLPLAVNGPWLRVKDETLSVEKMMAGSPHWQRFVGGVMVHMDLKATDYHRFHTPVDATVADVEQVAGLAYGTTTLDTFFEQRMRTLVLLQTKRFGFVALMPIGISDIGSIRLLVKRGQSISRGQELGYFAYGGSTIVMFFEKSRKVDFFVNIDQSPDGAPVKVNSCLARIS